VIVADYKRTNAISYDLRNYHEYELGCRSVNSVVGILGRVTYESIENREADVHGRDN
jgi:hypothetical protein